MNPTPRKLTLLEERMVRALYGSPLHRVVRHLIKGTRPKAEDLAHMGMSKSQVVELMYPDLVYDTALPQLWLNYWRHDEYETVRSATIWAYPESVITGWPVALTEEAHNLIQERECGRRS